jgi:hypothetical protein
MLRAAIGTVIGICLVATAIPVSAAQYKVFIKRLDANTFQAHASKVIIETRRCGDWMPEEELEEAILNWDGPLGYNWIVFTGSGTKCDVALIRTDE